MSLIDGPGQMAADVRALLDAIADIDNATTPEEQAAAQLRAETGSWAVAEYVPGRAEYEVHSYGPRDLWAEVADAYLQWVSWGRPARSRFGLTLTPEDATVWLDDPAQPVQVA